MAAGAPDGQGKPPPLPQGRRAWAIRRKDIAQAIRYGKRRSAPGPDGLPYGVWQALGDLGVDILGGVALVFERDDATSLLDEAYRD